MRGLLLGYPSTEFVHIALFLLFSLLPGSMDWSPLDAMKAYMHSLQLCSDYYKKESDTEGSKLIEPKSMEFISALAAGNRARLMVDVASSGMSPFTLALAAAAKQTGSRLVCLRSEPTALEETKNQLRSFDLEDVAEFKSGSPCEVLKQYNNIDFAVIEHKIKDAEELFFALDMNPRGSMVVVTNLLNGRRSEASYAQAVKGRGRVESIVLPIGEGIEVTRIGRGGRHERGGKRATRTWIVFED